MLNFSVVKLCLTTKCQEAFHCVVVECEYSVLGALRSLMVSEFKAMYGGSEEVPKWDCMGM